MDNCRPVFKETPPATVSKKMSVEKESGKEEGGEKKWEGKENGERG